LGYLKLLFGFQGRATRLTYWRFQVLQVSVAAALLILASFGTIVGGWLGAVPLACLPLLVLTGFCITVRRLHDRGKSLWWALVFTFGPWALIAPSRLLGPQTPPLAIVAAAILAIAGGALGLWAWVEIGFLGGDRSDNRYGPPPSHIRPGDFFRIEPAR